MEPERPLLADFEQQIRGLAAELRELVALRWQLARFEIESDLLAVKRLTGAAGAAVVMGLAGLPLVAACAAELLDGRWGVSRAGWLALMGAGLLGAAATVGLSAWRRFRREVVALKETLAEFREDQLWLQEWTDRGP